MHAKNVFTSAAALAATLMLLPLAQASPSTGIGGAWYNPEQSGHGISIEVLAPDRALMFWYLYDSAGNPFFLYLDGRIEGRRIEATAVAPQGLHFGTFDRSNFSTPTWGTVSIEFDDCNNARLEWDALSSEFGSGSTDLRRLSRTYGSECVLEAAPPALAGPIQLLVKDMLGDDLSGVSPHSGIGAIDPDGRIWAMETPWTDLSPMGGWTGPFPCVVLGSIEARPSQPTRASLRELANAWSATSYGSACVGAAWQGTAQSSATEIELRNSSALVHRRWQFSARETVQIETPLAMGQLAKEFEVTLRWWFGEMQVPLHVQPDGSICLGQRLSVESPMLACALRGRLWLTDPQNGFFDFELAASNEPEATPYRGRGWLEARGDGQRLVMIGHSAQRGLGVVGR